MKLCLLTFKAQHDQAPVNLVRRCVRVSSDAGRARLRSASTGQLVVPRTSKKTFGDRAFASSGPISWNCQLSVQYIYIVRDDCLSLHSFKKLLKIEIALLLAAFADILNTRFDTNFVPRGAYVIYLY